MTRWRKFRDACARRAGKEFMSPANCSRRQERLRKEVSSAYLVACAEDAWFHISFTLRLSGVRSWNATLANRFNGNNILDSIICNAWARKSADGAAFNSHD